MQTAACFAVRLAEAVGACPGVGGVSMRPQPPPSVAVALGSLPRPTCPLGPLWPHQAAGRVKELCRGRMQGFMEPMSSPVRWGHSHSASWSAGCRGKRAAQASAQPRATRRGWALSSGRLAAFLSASLRVGIKTRGERGGGAARPRHSAQERGPTKSNKESGRAARQQERRPKPDTKNVVQPVMLISQWKDTAVPAKKRKMAEMLGTERRGGKDEIRTMQWIPDSS